MSLRNRKNPAVVLFDFGGVLAEEGFAAGLRAIAEKNGLDPEIFFSQAEKLIYECGYVTGDNNESGFWALVRDQCGISGSDSQLTAEIQNRFVLRPGMLAKVRAIKAAGIRTAILSDQTDWLEQIDGRHPFLHEFAPVLNSFYLGSSKRDPKTFQKAVKILGVEPGSILFVDDNAGHIGRAAALGFQVHHFVDERAFSSALRQRGLPTPDSNQEI